MKYLWLLLTGAVILLLFYNSSLPMSESGKMSAYVASWLEQAASLVNVDLGRDLEYHVRKMAHFASFALLSWLLCKTFAAFHTGNRYADGYILFAGLLVAVLDEYIQLSAPGRGSSIADVLLDFSGVLCMWLSMRLWQWCR